MTTLAEAIERSQRNNERVSVEFVGDCAELLAELNAMIDSDSDIEIDNTTENDGPIDVWCYDPHQSDSEMTWRLLVTLVR
jgi:hypothetical protein